MITYVFYADGCFCPLYAFNICAPAVSGSLARPRGKAPGTAEPYIGGWPMYIFYGSLEKSSRAIDLRHTILTSGGLAAGRGLQTGGGIRMECKSVSNATNYYVFRQLSFYRINFGFVYKFRIFYRILAGH